VQIASISIPHLPALGAELDGGLFAGITTTVSGQHAAIVLLPAKPEKRLTWAQAISWAEQAGGQLPTRPVAAQLYATLKPQFEEVWHWTVDQMQDDIGEEGASYAWYCTFGYGNQGCSHKSYEGLARAVRLIPLTA